MADANAKDVKNLREVLDKIASMDGEARTTMQRMHEVILAAAPALKPRIWYGMPGYARSASSPVLVFFRNDELMSLGISEKAKLVPADERDGRLVQAAWFFDGLDDATERRVTEIVRTATDSVAAADRSER